MTNAEATRILQGGQHSNGKPDITLNQDRTSVTNRVAVVERSIISNILKWIVLEGDVTWARSILIDNAQSSGKAH